MAKAAVRKKRDFWIESVLENKSLVDVIHYLQSVTGRPIIITDYLGRVYAHSSDIKMKSPDDHYIKIPRQDRNRFHYEPANKTLYYYTGFTENDVCILIVDVADGKNIGDWKMHLEKVSVAVKIFVSIAQETEKTKNQLTHKLLEDILIRNVCNIKEIVKQYNSALDLNKLYYVSIMEPDPVSDNNLQILYGHTKEWLRYHNLDIICSVWNRRFLVFICPTHFDEQTLEADRGWGRHLKNIRKHQRDIMDSLNLTTSFGIGRKYPLPELHKSYQEALTALNIAKLTGKKNAVTHFLELGYFTIINFQDLILLRQFCSETLRKLLEHDRSNKGELLQTLRVLFDNNFDVNDAAQKMYIHFNTMRYRIKKIEELTGTRLEQLQDKFNLFVAVKLYDLLIANGFLGEGTMAMETPETGR